MEKSKEYELIVELFRALDMSHPDGLLRRPWSVDSCVKNCVEKTMQYLKKENNITPCPSLWWKESEDEVCAKVTIEGVKICYTIREYLDFYQLRRQEGAYAEEFICSGLLENMKIVAKSDLQKRYNSIIMESIVNEKIYNTTRKSS